jgi:hypothetical protein
MSSHREAPRIAKDPVADSSIGTSAGAVTIHNGQVTQFRLPGPGQ